MDGKTPLVSVIMSVYNGERWLREAIDSIIHQEFSDWEMLICDDASGKATKEILDGVTDQRIRIFTNESQLGLTRNLNMLINKARGKYIARMDADDVSLPHRFKKQVQVLQENSSISMVAGWIEFIDENGNKKGEWNNDRKYSEADEIASVIAGKNVIAHPTIMIRSEVIKKLRYNEKQKHSQDWDLWMRMTAAGMKISKLREVVLKYRLHGESVTSSAKNKSVFLKIAEVYKNYLASVTPQESDLPFNKKVKKLASANRIKGIGSSIKNIFRS